MGLAKPAASLPSGLTLSLRLGDLITSDSASVGLACVTGPK